MGNLLQPIRNPNQDTSSVWNSCARSSDVVSRGNQSWCREMSAGFPRLAWGNSRAYQLTSKNYTLNLSSYFFSVLVMYSPLRGFWSAALLTGTLVFGPWKTNKQTNKRVYEADYHTVLKIATGFGLSIWHIGWTYGFGKSRRWACQINRIGLVFLFFYGDRVLIIRGTSIQGTPLGPG